MTRMLAVTIAALLLAGCSDLRQTPAEPEAALLGVGPHGGGPPGSVVFYSARDGNLEIYLMNADGSGQRRITDDPGEDVWPDLSPNGRYVAFASNRTGNREIFVMDLASGDLVNVSNSPADDNWPRWSPNGRQLAFHSNRDGNYELYVVNRDGNGLRRVTNHPLLDQWPDWSPNGKQLAFRRGMDVYVIDADGEEQKPVQLTNLPATLDQMPVWSPNGKQLAFMSFRAGYCAVFLMSAEGDAPQQPAVNLTPKDPDDPASAWCSRAPAWSRNGQQIYFMSFRPSTGGAGAAFNEIFVMNGDGTGLRRLTASPSEDGGPRMR